MTPEEQLLWDIFGTTEKETEMIIEQFVRKSFPVEAVQVSATNMEDVAKWCDGEIRDNTDSNVTHETRQEKYIKVRVQNPLTERQTKAFPGDWVLYAGKGYKVYTNKAFRKSFDENGVPKPQGPPLPVGITATVVADEEGNLPQNIFADAGGGGTATIAEGSGGPNPGGTASVGG